MIEKAVDSLRRAYDLAIIKNTSLAQFILEYYKKARRIRWEIIESQRMEKDTQTFEYLDELIEKDQKRQEASTVSESDILEIRKMHVRSSLL